MASIPDPAVEAALTALDQSWIADASREQWGGILRDILEAAEPHIAAQVWEQAYDDGFTDRNYGAGRRDNPYRAEP